MTEKPAGWYPDPEGRRSLQYWDGSDWLLRSAPLPEDAAAKAANPAPVRRSVGLAQGFGYVQRALSLRNIFGSLFAGLCAGVALGIVWASAVMPAFWITAAACYLLTVLNPGQMVTCDACRKRVKMGATTCHHCGYSRA